MNCYVIGERLQYLPTGNHYNIRVTYMNNKVEQH